MISFLSVTIITSPSFTSFKILLDREAVNNLCLWGKDLTIKGFF